MNNAINTNLSALFGANQLSRNQKNLQAIFTQLASGSRINSARDDAAGLAIGNRLQTQVNGLTSAIGNANNGISLVQTADNALGQIGDALQRVRELSLQAANDTYSSQDRSFIQKEIDQLKSEINRIAETTTFNGKPVLNGVLGQVNIQVGANAGQSVTLGGFDATTAALGSQPGVLRTTSDRVQLTTGNTGSQGIQEGDADIAALTDVRILTADNAPAEAVNIADERFGGAIASVADTAQLTDPNSDNYGQGLAKSIAERINSIREQGEPGLERVFASAVTTFKGSDLQAADYSGSLDALAAPDTRVAAGNLQSGDLQINGVDIGPVQVEDNDPSGALVAAINARSEQTGVSAVVDDQGELNLTANDGRDIVISTASADVSNQLFGNGEARFDEPLSDLRVTGQVSVTAPDTLSFGGTSLSLSGLDEPTEDNVQATGNLAAADVSTSQQAQSTVEDVDAALQSISDFRSSLGAIYNRFESTLRNLDSSREAQSAAASRVRDTDFAQQIADLSKNLFKQQAGIALQAQANALSQQILQLLV